MVPGPTRALNPNSISIGSAVIAGFISVTDRPVSNNRLHMHIRFLLFLSHGTLKTVAADWDGACISLTFWTV